MQEETPPDMDALDTAEPVTAHAGEWWSVSSAMGLLNRREHLAACLRYKGVPYVWGGKDASGVDCSGLIYAGAHDLGVQIPRTASQQWAACDGITREQAQGTPGALVFLRRQAPKGKSPAGSIVHVGMSDGQGRMVEAWYNKQVVTPRFGWWDRSYADYPAYYGLLKGSI